MKHNDKTIHVFCPAKINLGLKVGRKREDGFHEIESIFQTVNLYDEIKIKIQNNSYDTLEIESQWNLPTDQNNLIIKGLNLYRTYSGKNVHYHISLLKRIPIGSGLAGGSSDAVGAILAASILNKKFLSKDELFHLLAQVGSDCPFFYDGGLQYVTGRGDRLIKIPIKIHEVFLIWVPGVQSDTKSAYQALKRDLTYPSQKHILLDYFLNSSPWWSFEVYNDFEEIISPKIKNWKLVKEFFDSNKSVWTSMSGSGSALVAAFKDFKTAEQVFSIFFDKQHCFLVEPVQYGLTLNLI